MNDLVLAADLGGTNLRMAVIDDRGAIICHAKRETPRTGSVDVIVRSIIDLANECRSRSRDSGNARAIAAALPGGIDYRNGTIIKAPNLAALDGFPMSAVLERELGVPAILENDANAAAIGEAWIGGAKGVRCSVTVTIGTGVGAGIVIDGEILRGIDGLAGEIGHVCVEPNGHPCGCGSFGCVEQYVSATAIVRQTKELSDRYPDSVFARSATLESADVFNAGLAGDALALEVFRRMGFYLGIGLGGLINTLNPEVVVIGGGAAAGWDLFIAHAREQIGIRAFKVAAERALTVPAMLGDDAGILGAARLGFWNREIAATPIAART